MFTVYLSVFVAASRKKHSTEHLKNFSKFTGDNLEWSPLLVMFQPVNKEELHRNYSIAFW